MTILRISTSRNGFIASVSLVCTANVRCTSGLASINAMPRTVSRLPPVPTDCHRLVLMRHGESEFNNANIFTGWCDVALTPRGVVEAVEAGQVFLSHGLHFRKCYVSLLTRSIVTAQRCLEAAGVAYTPLEYDWRWNERHYGALQGLSKERTAIRLGREKVMEWRRSYHAPPPLMTPEHPHYQSINEDPRYRRLADIPKGESLQDCQIRAVQAWDDLMDDIKAIDDDTDFHYSLLVAHANTLRALVMHLNKIPAHQIEDLNIPTAIPFYYDINKKTGEIVQSITFQEDEETVGEGVFSGIYITDERKQRSFLERRRAANDPWLWALRDEQVDVSLLDGETETTSPDAVDPRQQIEMDEEARRNTELFSENIGSLLKRGGSREGSVPKF